MEIGMDSHMNSQNFNGAADEVWKWIDNFIPHSIGYVVTRLNGGSVIGPITYIH